MPVRNTTLVQLGHVFQGADAGAFTLPDEVTVVRKTVDRLNAELARPPVQDPSATRAALQDAMAEAARTGEDLPEVTPLLEAEAAYRAWELARQLVDELTDRAESSLAAVTCRLADRIVVEHLRPALEDVVKQARAAVAACPADHPQALLMANEKARKAWLELEALSQRYGAIRTAQGALARVASPPQKDTAGQFAEMNNLASLVPGGRLRPGMEMPWPSEPRARFVRLVRNGAEFTMPTAAEQDRAWEVAHPPRRPAANVPVAL